MEELARKEGHPESQEYLNGIRQELHRAYAKGTITALQLEELWDRALERMLPASIRSADASDRQVDRQR
jgi:hypothetical protein